MNRFRVFVRGLTGASGSKSCSFAIVLRINCYFIIRCLLDGPAMVPCVTYKLHMNVLYISYKLLMNHI